MKLRNVLTFFFLLLVNFINAQEDVSEDMYVKKDFLIIISTKDYKTALATAKQASSSLNIELQLRGLSENKESGLTISKKECEKQDIEYPAYYARGRWDDGLYISIEYSDAYSGFTEGYFIVIAASGSKEAKEMLDIYKKTKLKYRDTYFKSSKVYMGCMH